MRIGNLDGRLTVFSDGGAVDVALASGQQFSADPQAVYRAELPSQRGRYAEGVHRRLGPYGS
jgi:hypothetical protein